MLLGAHLAGAAIENSMLGAAHALANPLTAHFDVTHGLAVGLMLPHVIRFNAVAVGEQYGRLAHDAGLCATDAPDAADRLAEWVSRTVQQATGLAVLEDVGVDPAMLPTLAQEAARQWTGTFNPRPVSADSLEELYRCALSMAS
jgi:alcohol dehydrogenase